ncbi:MAG: hypothetical protein J7623_28775 [Chitinophaga sp.]|uniref:hypothetical protein n=1 Tax=Chitinophaga sp. TaxID=1869181 RepID=UPI001B26166F|nr:hypothetical protein [Chitinophaga sp.]MBO9732672.1 hypothetical protein [Chitinophaga sp.]
MANHLLKFLPALLLAVFSTADTLAQETDFEALSKVPRDTTYQFPPDYKIARPRLAAPSWDEDYDAYTSFLTPAMKKTQAYMNFQDKGVTTVVTPNSIIPHAQLDTTTAVNDPGKLVGTWRMLKFRSIRFNDSVYLPTQTYYRLPDVVLDDKSQDDAFAVITDNNIKMYVKEAGKPSFKKMMSGKYKVENGRSLMMYKVFKSDGGVSQYGIDEKGHLIINYPSVIENIKKGEYFSYYAVIQQYIYERVK